MAVQKVEGVIPAEMSDVFIKDLFPEESLANENKKSLFAQVKENIERKQEARENKKFKDLRLNLIANTMGWTKEELQLRIKEFENAPSELSEKEKLERARSIWLGQKNANKNDKRSTIMGNVSRISSLFLGLIMPESLIISLIANIFIAVHEADKYKKRSIGNSAEESEKQEAYNQQYLIPLMEKLQKLDNALSENKEEILNAKKTMSKEEFEKYINDILLQKLSELHIDSPLIQNDMLDTFEETPGKINDMIKENTAEAVL